MLEDRWNVEIGMVVVVAAIPSHPNDWQTRVVAQVPKPGRCQSWMKGGDAKRKKEQGKEYSPYQHTPMEMLREEAFGSHDLKFSS